MRHFGRQDDECSGRHVFRRVFIKLFAHAETTAPRDPGHAFRCRMRVRRNFVTGGPAAGVTFQTIATGPFQIMNDPAAPSLIQVATTRPQPEPPNPGDHIVVLDYNVECDITKVTATGAGSNHWDVFLANGNENRIQTKSGSFVICYITRRIGYVVNNGELRFYPNLIATPTTYAVIARNVTSATPFSIPLNQSGTPETRFTAVTVTVSDPSFSNRGYKATSMEMANAGVPYRCVVTKYQ